MLILITYLKSVPKKTAEKYNIQFKCKINLKKKKKYVKRNCEL